MTVLTVGQLLVLAVIGICLSTQTVILFSTTQDLRRTLTRLNGILPQVEQLLKKATHTVGEGEELLHRANRVTHGVLSFFTGRRFGNGTRGTPRKGVMKG